VPLVVWLCLDQFRSIPPALDDAAKVDGCNLWQTFFYIDMRVAIPGIAVSAILTFIFAWNELIFGLLLTNSPDGARTAPPQATTFMSGMGIEWGEVMATGTLIILPVVIFAALVSQHIIQGLTMGAVE
jgi:multiple sugar transport system permease protein